jgi:YesN/AraC family two-component response regulator
MYKLMICDDESLERAALRKMIERGFPGITLLEDAVTGQEAIIKALAYAPHILLIDVGLPEKSGLEAQKEIIEVLPDIKTVIISAHDDFYYAREAMRCRVFDYLLKPVSPETLYSSIERILLALGSGPASPSADGTLPEGAIRDAVSYIEAHFLEDLRLGDAAAVAKLSVKYFSRYFKEQTGCTFTDYVNLLKVARGKDLLTNTRAAIYSIARDLNFSDAAYFSKVFLKYEKISPMRYRKKHSKA